MSETKGMRTVLVTLHTTIASKATHEIDVAEYDEWRGDKSDTPQMVKEFLESDRDYWDLMGELYERAQKRGDHEVFDSETIRAAVAS